MCIYSLTDYMLLVSVIDVYFHGSTAVYMHIHITLFTEGSSLRRRSPVAHEKNDCQPTIYACRTTVSSTDLVRVLPCVV